jgi:hypothetical protein
MSTPLQYVVKYNNISIVEKLVRAGAAVNAPPNLMQGRTAIQFAASNGNCGMIVLVMDAGADMNARHSAYNGRTALEAALEHGNSQIANYLFIHGAEPQDDITYRRSSYRAWKNNHRISTSVLQGWMKERDGREGIEPVENIVKSVTEVELSSHDEAAKMEYEAHNMSMVSIPRRTRKRQSNQQIQSL